MPLLLLLILLTELLTVGFIILDVHLIREWYIWKDTIDDEYAAAAFMGQLLYLPGRFLEGLLSQGS